MPHPVWAGNRPRTAGELTQRQEELPISNTAGLCPPLLSDDLVQMFWLKHKEQTQTYISMIIKITTTTLFLRPDGKEAGDETHSPTSPNSLTGVVQSEVSREEGSAEWSCRAAQSDPDLSGLVSMETTHVSELVSRALAPFVTERVKVVCWITAKWQIYSLVTQSHCFYTDTGFVNTSITNLLHFYFKVINQS